MPSTSKEIKDFKEQCLEKTCVEGCSPSLGLDKMCVQEVYKLSRCLLSSKNP